MEAKLTEKAFMAMVLKLARLCGWEVYHTHNSRRSEAGFPDLCLVHPRRGLVLFRELKTDKGKLTPAQCRWIDGLSDAGANVDVWRPQDWWAIEKLLKGY